MKAERGLCGRGAFYNLPGKDGRMTRREKEGRDQSRDGVRKSRTIAG